MTQSARLEALQQFKDGEVPLLIASDVAARGLDIAGLSHVFNFDVPGNAEDYVHRIGGQVAPASLDAPSPLRPVTMIANMWPQSKS